MAASIAINPGSGPVDGATAEQAAVTIKQFITDLAARGLDVVETRRNPDADYDREDGDGRFAFDLVFADGREVQIQMPGLPVEQVRWLGSDQDIWQFPRLYVDDSSWVWFYALNACHPDDSDSEAVAGQPSAVEKPSFGEGGSCPECGAELAPNNCTSGVCPKASCHNCGYGCDLFNPDGAGKCIAELRKKLPSTRYER